MMTKFLYNITRWLLYSLKNRGVDVSKLNPKTDNEIKIEQTYNKVLQLEGMISIKRAEIIDGQRDLLQMVEPTLFTVLSNSDGWQKNTVTKLWIDKLKEINVLVDEHQRLIIEFEDTYHKLKSTGIDV